MTGGPGAGGRRLYATYSVRGVHLSLLAISEQALNGLIISTLYALTALGLSIIFGVLRIVHFAHGEIYMLGGYVYSCAAGRLGLPPVIAVHSAEIGRASCGERVCQYG